MQVATQWNASVLEPFDIHNPVHVDAAMKDLSRALGRAPSAEELAAALELASLAEEVNAKDLPRAIEAVNARIKDVDDLHSSLAREFGLYICAATAPQRRLAIKPFRRAPRR